MTLQQGLGAGRSSDLSHRRRRVAPARGSGRPARVRADRSLRWPQGERPQTATRSAGPGSALQARDQQRADRPRRGGRAAQPLLDAPASAAAERGGEAQRQHGPLHAGRAQRGNGRPDSSMARSSWEPAVPSGSSISSASSSRGARGRSGSSSPRARRSARRPSGPKRSATWSAESAASCRGCRAPGA